MSTILREVERIIRECRDSSAVSTNEMVARVLAALSAEGQQEPVAKEGPMSATLIRSPTGQFFAIDSQSRLRWPLTGPYLSYCLIQWNLVQMVLKSKGKPPLPEDRWFDLASPLQQDGGGGR